MSATQAFLLFTRTAIPIMEDNIEVRLLQNFTKNLNPLEKDEVYQAYIQRKENFKYILEKEDIIAP